MTAYTVDHKTGTNGTLVIWYREPNYESSIFLTDKKRVFDLERQVIVQLYYSSASLYAYSYSVQEPRSEFKEGDTVHVKDSGETFRYDGTNFFDKSSTLTARLERIELVMNKLCETMMEIRDTLGYLPGNSEYECAKERFENRVNEKK